MAFLAAKEAMAIQPRKIIMVLTRMRIKKLRAVLWVLISKLARKFGSETSPVDGKNFW